MSGASRSDWVARVEVEGGVNRKWGNLAMSENDSCSMAPSVFTWRVQFSCLSAVLILYHLDSQRLMIDHAELMLDSLWWTLTIT